MTLNRCLVLCLIVLIFSPIQLGADTINFDDLPAANFFLSGGQNIGSFYPGLTVGSDVTGLSASLFGGYDNVAFPAHSGDVVIWSPFDPDVVVSFCSPVSSPGIWYTSLDLLTLSAFDSANQLLGTSIGNANTDGFFGSSSFLSFSNPNIASIQISGVAGFFVLDDLTFEPTTSAPVPEPGTLLLLTSGIAFLCVKKGPRPN